MAAKTTHAVQDKIRERRKGLLPLLKKVHETEGYLSQESVQNISRKLRISENEIYGVATFYPQFRFKPPGKYNIHLSFRDKNGREVRSADLRDVEIRSNDFTFRNYRTFQ